MNKIIMLMLIISSQSIYAGVGDGSGTVSASEAVDMQLCLDTNSDLDKQKVRQLCEVITVLDSSDDGTGKPSTDEGTGRPK